MTMVPTVEFARLAALKGAVKLEQAGLRHSSGRSMTQVARELLGLKRSVSRDEVLAVLTEEVEHAIAHGGRIRDPRGALARAIWAIAAKAKDGDATDEAIAILERAAR